MCKYIYIYIYIYIQCLRPTPATALASGRCCFLRGCGLCGVACCCCFVFGASRKDPQYDPKPSQNRPKINKKEVENHVLRVIGAPWGVPWAHFGTGGPKVSAGTEKERKSELFPPGPEPQKRPKSVEKPNSCVFLGAGAKQQKKKVPGAGRGRQRPENRAKTM